MAKRGRPPSSPGDPAKKRAGPRVDDEVMFSDADLCDGKKDRAVVTCSLQPAGIAHTRGGAPPPPAALFVKEIEAQAAELSDNQLGALLLEDEGTPPSCYWRTL